jgi:hypothetical protein
MAKSTQEFPSSRYSLVVEIFDELQLPKQTHQDNCH